MSVVGTVRLRAWRWAVCYPRLLSRYGPAAVWPWLAERWPERFPERCEVCARKDREVEYWDIEGVPFCAPCWEDPELWAGALRAPHLRIVRGQP